MLTHYRCTERAPPPVADANAHTAPPQERDEDSALPLPLPPPNLFSLLYEFGRMRVMVMLLRTR
jgi:hypothetical protein